MEGDWKRGFGGVDARKGRGSENCILIQMYQKISRQKNGEMFI